MAVGGRFPSSFIFSLNLGIFISSVLNRTTPGPSVGVCRRLPNQFFDLAMIESCCAAEKGAG
jgi:hypothetical protein